jgi:hypothetical protein
MPGTDSTTNQVLKLLADSVPADTPVITLNKSQLNRSVHVGENLTDDSFTVTNTGAATLAYLVQDNQAWLSETPGTGASSGASDTITVSYAVSQLAVGTHQAVIQVLDNGSVPAAANSPQQIAVTVVVKTVLPDFDEDRDVDMSDYAFFQTCFTAIGQTVGPACEPADLNGDTLVNTGDLDLFLGCMSGADVPASKTCDDAFE